MPKITFLGTSTMIPTARRNNSAIFLSYKNENILIDCAEGTQRQMQIAGIKPPKITTLLITHWHGDHILGIPGLLQTLSASGYMKTLKIFGPRGTKKFVKQMMDMFVNEKSELKIEVKEVMREGCFYEGRDFELYAKSLKHTAPCLAYLFSEKDRRRINLSYTKKFGLEKHPLLGRLQKGRDVTYKGKKIKASKATTIIPGKKIGIVLDTVYFKEISKFVKDVDLLICESTVSDELEEKAKLYKHLTASHAAKIAKDAKAKRLILTHFSQRYKTPTVLRNQARRTYKKVQCANDFMEVEV